MQPSKNAFDLVQNSEGCRLTAYPDTGGVWTIGYGHTQGVYEGQTISQSEAIQMLSDDIQDAAQWVNDLVTSQLSQNQFDALCDFVFNEGAGNFKKSHLLTLLNLDNVSAAADQFDRWVYSEVDGKEVILEGLVRRRTAEKSLFLQDDA